MKPGKPLTFATINSETAESMLVNKILAFGLPGNPVSCLVCFHLFVVPTIRKLGGWANPQLLRLLEFPERYSSYLLNLGFIHSLKWKQSEIVHFDDDPLSFLFIMQSASSSSAVNKDRFS